MWQASCARKGACARVSCLFPDICPDFKAAQDQCVELLHLVAAQPGVRHVRVASGVRFDLALRDPEALRAYTMEYTGGQLKIAPEHVCDEVLARMRKPGLALLEEFLRLFAAASKSAGKEQYIVPYLISAFPGCTLEHMRALRTWLRHRGWSPRQTQCFIPTPGTVASAMYYAGVDPSGQKIYVARSDKERREQHEALSRPD
jgi:uncharacterized radical SAM protein YgiQ